MSNVENEYAWKVCVRCFTFNHAPYIEDAMNGFCMQETDFPFVCTIVDDASTDGEQDVIKRYLEEHFDLEEKSVVRNEETEDYTLTFARHKTNRNCYFAVLYLKYNHYSKPTIEDRKFQYISEWHENCKYIALCEGDDYWIDGKKLQKQVKLLDDTPNVLLIYSGFKTVDEKGLYIDRPFYDNCIQRSHSGDNLLSLYKGNYIMTLTIMMHKSVWNSKEFVNCPQKFDYALVLSAAIDGEFIFLPDITGCYRMNPDSITMTKKDYLEEALWKIYKYFSRLIIIEKRKKMSVVDSLMIRLHVLVHSLRENDSCFMKEIKENDVLSRILYPLGYICYKIKW